MKISPRLVIVAPALLAAGWSAPATQAQETLAGVGAASAAGASLGAAAAGGMSMRGMTRGVPGPGGQGMDPGAMAPGSPAGMPVGEPGMSGMGMGGAAPAATRTVTPFAGIRNGSTLLSQLLSVPIQRQPMQVRRSARGQAAYSRRVARMSPTARKKLVLNKYKVAPRGYLASYLPQDRYKFAKAWKFVSTETDRFYYTPQGMARRGFSPNRVIGFRTWQDAMLAGYRPDPASKPAPGNQFAFFASLTRDEPLVHYLEYAYSGQVSPSSLDATYNYVRRVKSIIDRNPHVRQYQRSTVNSILEAALTGDSSLIPTVLGQPAPVLVTAPAGQPSFPPGGFPPGGVPQGGFPPSGVPQGGFPPSGFPQGGVPQGGFPPSSAPVGGKRSGGMAPAT